MKTLSRGLSALTLVAWGVLMLYFYLSGRLAEYLVPAYRPMVAVAGVVMLLLAVSMVWTNRGGVGGLMSDGLAGDDRFEASASPRIRATQVLAFLMLVVPVWAAVGVSADRFSASTMLNRGIVSDPSKMPGKASAAMLNAASQAGQAPPSAQNAAAAPANYEPPLPGATPIPADATPSALDASQYLKKTADGNVIAEVTDLLFASDDDSMRPLFDKRKIEMIGQYMPADKGGANRFQIVRMFMVCCAADARPIAVSVESKDAPKLAEMAWARVIGTVDFPVEDGHRLPIVHAESVQACDPPAELMLY
jgi:uncharacterized repeat protein (TIGR03943 family)